MVNNVGKTFRDECKRGHMILEKERLSRQAQNLLLDNIFSKDLRIYFGTPRYENTPEDTIVSVVRAHVGTA